MENRLEEQEKRYGSLKSDVEKWVLSSNGVFLSSDVVKDLHLSSREEKQNLSTILRRLCTDGIIERSGNKHGVWKKRDLTINRIDWKGSNADALNIKWPFELERLYTAKEKNIIVIGGSPDSGKTAFLLNVVAENAGTYPIRYLSSEMGADELQSRIMLFEDTEPFEYCEFEERSFDFHDRVNPDGINIIDFLEIWDSFFLISEMIRNIWAKLGKGIAIIAIQKNPGSENPRGGAFALEKARLALMMDAGTAKITKCKNWYNPLVNPNRRSLEYKLHKGSNFQITREWMAEEDLKEMFPEKYKETSYGYKKV